ncbi:MAG: thioredoxin-dependent thiol peroxidase [Alphaproteobacteria bacterium]|nr:MAG: thioredoxin-dependent thiol peroxidase [Alphaproteobacteria bacterium]
MTPSGSDELKEGDLAPDFTLPADDGRTVHLGDLRGHKVVLYFYPKDSTPGCTQEAKDFSALLDEFAAADTRVFGISRDSLRRHENFRNKYALKVPLLSDEEGTVSEAYGVWKEKKNYGRTYMGIERSTFLIDREGRIARIWRKVRVKGHAVEVLEAARALDE